MYTSIRIDAPLSSLLLNIFDANVESEPERREGNRDSAFLTGFYPTVNFVRSRDHLHLKFKAAMALDSTLSIHHYQHVRYVHPHKSIQSQPKKS
jgi:hypothetical protein